MTTISHMLSENARLYPDNTALVEYKPSNRSRKEITWKELDEGSNRVANALLARNIRRDDRVIHWMMNSIEWLQVYFGIIRTGAWAVPLNFRFSSKDLVYCADIAKAKAMMLGEEFIGRVKEVKSRLQSIRHFIFSGNGTPEGMENYENMLSISDAFPPNIELTGDDECGLYFTSGTTGAPKPILLTHRNMEFAAIVEQSHHYQNRQDNFILIPPLYHAGAKMHWFGNLIVGAKATILTEVSPHTIFETVDKERGTIVWLLVPWAHDILVAMDRGELNKSDFDIKCWRLMHIGAQPVPPALVQRWKRYFPTMQYDTNYGLTEASGPGCVHLGIENEHKVGSIGKAGFGWETRIVDDNGMDVEQGDVGELIVKGYGVMKEYFKNPEKTEETIQEGWLYTGDMAKEAEHGFIYLVDRKKDIIITGGENIYPVEIEDLLHSHPKIYDVAVIGFPDDRLGEIVFAVIDPKPGEILTESDVLSYCEQNLAKYKRPRRVVFDKIPRSPTGKIEKPSLRRKYCES